MLPCIYYDIGSGNMKWMKFWDTISSILVLLGMGLYGSSCYYGAWSLVYAALRCIVLGALIAAFTQRCPFCRRYLGTVNHAFVDGAHIGQLFQKIEEILKELAQ